MSYTASYSEHQHHARASRGHTAAAALWEDGRVCTGPRAGHGTRWDGPSRRERHRPLPRGDRCRGVRTWIRPPGTAKRRCNWARCCRGAATRSSWRPSATPPRPRRRFGSTRRALRDLQTDQVDLLYAHCVGSFEPGATARPRRRLCRPAGGTTARLDTLCWLHRTPIARGNRSPSWSGSKWTR